MGYAIRLRLALMSLVIMVGVVGCDRDDQSPKSETSDLKRAIAEVEGAYAWRDDLNRYEYWEKLRLEEILSAQSKEAAVTVLVACLDVCDLQTSFHFLRRRTRAAIFAMTSESKLPRLSSRIA